MIRYLIGAIIGGVLGYFVLYKLIGCSTGTCPITANPFSATVYGIIIGLLLSTAIAPEKKIVPENAAQTPKIEYKKISAKEAKSRIDSGDKIIILDVRTLEEYNQGHIRNSVLIPNETITDKKPNLLPDLNADILVYCRSGNRSEQAVRKLIALGYTKVYDFGGINDWPYEVVK